MRTGTSVLGGRFGSVVIDPSGNVAGSAPARELYALWIPQRERFVECGWQAGRVALHCERYAPVAADTYTKAWAKDGRGLSCKAVPWDERAKALAKAAGQSE